MVRVGVGEGKLGCQRRAAHATFHDLHDERWEAAGIKGVPQGTDLVEEASQRPDVRFLAIGLVLVTTRGGKKMELPPSSPACRVPWAACLAKLWGKVVRGPDHGLDQLGLGAQHLADAKVAQLDNA